MRATNSVGTRFSLVVVGFALALTTFTLYRSWQSSRADMEELLVAETDLALEFDLAIRKYAGEVIRPEVQKLIGPDEFILEAMSTSYIARNVFEKVRQRFPDHVIKFSAENPRNPVNQAGPDEVKMLAWFRDHPEENRWVGKLRINGERYLTHLYAMRMEESCLQCHGRPGDAPEELIARYGAEKGFHRQVGEVAGMDLVAIPMTRVEAVLSSHTTTDMIVLGMGLVLLFALLLLAFRLMVARRLRILTQHFAQSAASGGDCTVSPVPVGGNDEIGILASSFNALAARLRAVHSSLEERVQERTADLAATNEALTKEVAERKRAEEAVLEEKRHLRRLLDMDERARRMVAYEIHDGVAQSLAAAQMALDNCERRVNNGPEDAAEDFQRASQLVHDALSQARRLMTGQRPMILDEQGLAAALEHLVYEKETENGPEIEFLCELRSGRLAPPLETAVFRIVQESFQNALWHSHSDRVAIRVRQRDGTLSIDVEDWGVGFDPAAVDPQRFGLEGIRERARLFGGRAVIDTAPGSGTRIHVELPVVEANTAE